MNLECVSLGKRQITKNDNNNYRTDIYIMGQLINEIKIIDSNL